MIFSDKSFCYWLLLVAIGMMQKIMVSMSNEMVEVLEQERKARRLESVPETVRAVLGEYFKEADG
jgi:Arc/MetJ-type ribon-helix-helix transcriptional regulator